MKIKNNESGLAHLAAILTVIAIVTIGAVGLRVWDKKDTKTSNESPATATQPNVKVEVIKGYKLYEDKNLAIQYLGSWTPYKDKTRPEWAFFKSKDFVEATKIGPSAEAGYQLEVRVSRADDPSSFNDHLTQVKKAYEKGGCGGDYEVIKIDGEQAIKSDMKCSGTEIFAILYKNGNEYFFRLNSLDEDKPEVRELFTSILNTVEIK